MAADDGRGRHAGTTPGDGHDGLAPVIPLFGDRPGRASRSASASRGNAGTRVRSSADHSDADDWHPPVASGRRTRVLAPVDVGSSSDEQPGAAGDVRPSDEPSAEQVRDDAEAVLLRKLRSRSLSLSEARTVLRGVEGVDEIICDELIDRFVDLGYLDDATFAEQLVMSAMDKRGEGRRAVAETLRKRGIPRDVAEAALATLPDDDAERALDFARSKIRGVQGAEYDAALRRLSGQLARRGYPSSVALTAARTALSEAGIGRSRSSARPASGVRFTPDD